MDKISFMPYTKRDGVPTFRDSEIANMYTRIFEEGLGDILFHDGTINTEKEFVTYVKSPDCMFWVAYDGEQQAGFFWINRIEKTHAYLHFCFFRDWIGSGRTVEIGKKVNRMLLGDARKDTQFFDLILGMIPTENKIAIAYTRKVGYKIVGEIPNLLWSEVQGKSVGGTIVSLTRGDLE